MIKENNSLITSNQLSCMIISTVIGSGVLFYPNIVVRDGRQDGWICSILGGVYLIYMVLIASYICSKFPDENILKLSKRYLGKFIGNTFNAIFLLYFYFSATIKCANLSDLVRLYVNYFVTQKLAIILIVITVVYSTYKGITVLARGNEVIHYFTLIMILVPLGVFTRGDPHNLLPVFNVSPVGIAKGSVTAGIEYYGVEIIFLLYPFLNNKADILKSGLKAAVICIAICTWFVFTSIYYLGIDIMPKYLWVVVETSKAFRMNTIKNFTFIFIFFWVMIVLKNISSNYFSSALILNELWSRWEIKKYTLILAPIMFYISLRYGNETTVRNIFTKTIPLFTLFNIIYVSIIALLIKMRRNKTNGNT
jgi:spore germination protein